MEKNFDDDLRDMCDRERELVDELEAVKERLDSVRIRMQNTSFRQLTYQVEELNRLKFQVKKKLEAHLSKVSGLEWSSDSQLLLTGAHDGKLIVWDSSSGKKVHMITSSSQWINGCSYSPGGRFVCCGGFDNVISIFDLRSNNQETPCIVLPEQDKYISCCKFLNDIHILSGSGDKNCTLWNIETSIVDLVFKGHGDDITCIDTIRNDDNIFVSASVDRTCRLWDVRCPERFVRVFEGHEHDVNCVCFFPEGSYGFVSASEDKACRLWDIRADQCIALYNDDSIQSGSTCVTLSRSGRLLIAGYDDYICHVWDLLREERVSALRGHDNRISGVKTSPDGSAIATTSWDATCIIWTNKKGSK